MFCRKLEDLSNGPILFNVSMRQNIKIQFLLPKLQLIFIFFSVAFLAWGFAMFGRYVHN